MVKFYDPIEKCDFSYHLNNSLKSKWDGLREGSLAKRGEDRVYIVDGRERWGKSTFTFQQAKYLDRSFNIDRICFTPDQFLDQIRNAPEGSVVVFDEAFRGLSSKASQSRVNKKIVEAMMEMGQRNLIVFIVLPTFFLLELYAAVLRTNALFHIYKDKKGRRRFRIYNYRQKSLLYRVGKKKGFDYGFPKVRIRGIFFSKFPINKKLYDKKKLDTFRGISDFERAGMIDKYLEKYHKMIYAFRNSHKLSEMKTKKRLKAYGIDISATNIGEITRKQRKTPLTHHPT